MSKRLLLTILLFIPLTTVAISCSPPREDLLIYRGPLELGVAAGSQVPGTGITYLGQADEDTVEVRIGDQRAQKRAGDSLDWTGDPLPETTLRLRQRVLWFNPEVLQLGGTIQLTLEGVSPEPGLIPDIPDQPVSNLAVFTVPVIYNVKAGERIPGTTLTYLGSSEEGAELSGLPVGEYPYRKAGDSITWQGQLRPGVYLKLVARTAFYGDQGLNLGGVATVILATGG